MNNCLKKQLKENEFTQVLNRYELEHNRIDRMGSRELELLVGLAYLDAKLYEEAFNHLITAYKQYKRSSRSARLLYGLGVAMDESGRDDDALKLFDAFVKRFPKSPNRVNVLLRSGQIYLEKKKYALSSKKFDAAYKTGKTHLEKAQILLSHATVYEIKNDFQTAADLRQKAIKEIALAKGTNYDALSQAYRELGRTYTVLKKYVKSADAYDKALNFSKNERERANLGFLLGDAYQKGNVISKAKDAYKQVVESYDSVWARMAQQRLNTLELAEIVQNS
jgi:tetratricopeptide (TPR) repeat protein